MAKAQAQEPSMEEILASIRRIIADEDTAPVAKPVAAPVPESTATVSEDELDRLFASDTEEADDDVLDLGDADKDTGPMDLVDDLSFEPAPVVKVEPVKMVEPVKKAKPDPMPEATPAPRRQPEPLPHFETAAEPPSRDPLLSQSTDTMVSAAFDNLAMTILNKNARTLEDLVQEMLRPMLKQWLDQNLPAIVERLVRAEIERVARGR
jgi:uncharacterized protein